MIKINKRNNNIPEELTCQKAKDAINTIEQKILSGETLESSDFDSKIFGHKNVKGALKDDQNDKCAYCESSLTGSFANVEHYRPKTEYKEDNISKKPGYYWLAYDWNNLFYSCDECNGQARKGNKFPLRDPNTRNITNKDISKEEPLIINPAIEDPQEHICFHKHIAVATSDKGKETIRIFDLNGKAEIRPNKALIEARKRRWDEAKSFLEESINGGKSANDSISIIKNIYGKDESVYAGMFRNQQMWLK